MGTDSKNQIARIDTDCIKDKSHHSGYKETNYYQNRRTALTLKGCVKSVFSFCSALQRDLKCFQSKKKKALSSDAFTDLTAV